MKVTDYEKECLSKCNFGDKRLTARALYIQISEVFKEVQNLEDEKLVIGTISYIQPKRFFPPVILQINSKYKHDRKAGSPDYLDGVASVLRRALS